MPQFTTDDAQALLALDDPEQLEDAVTVADGDGTILAVNGGFTRLHGYRPEQVIGGTPRVLSSGLQPAAVIRDLWTTISSGRTWEGELVDRGADGHLRTIATRITPIHDTSGTLHRFVAVQREVASPPAEAGGRLRLTRDGRCTYADPEAAGLLRHDADAVALLGPGLLETLSREDAEVLRDVLELADETGRRHQVDVGGAGSYVRLTVEPGVGDPQQPGGSVAQVLVDLVVDLADELAERRH